VFLKTSRLSGTSGLAPSQLVLYGRLWFTTVRVLILFCAIGGGLALLAALVARRSERWQPIADLVIASICGAPLILLVIAVASRRETTWPRSRSERRSRRSARSGRSTGCCTSDGRG